MDNMIANCHKCKYEITAECVPRSQKMSYPKCFVSIITNADRIRAMTDEELAETMHNMTLISMEIGLSTEWWLQWLKSPVEVDDGNS